MKITSWNVNSINSRIDRVLGNKVVKESTVVCFQELKCEENKFPLDRLKEEFEFIEINCQKRWNGVAIASRFPITDVKKSIPEDNDNARLIAGYVDGIRIVNIYVPQGVDPSSEKYEYKINWLNWFIKWLEEDSKKYENYLIAGDFNIAPSDLDVWSKEKWNKNTICCTEKERSLFEKILSGFNLVDTYRESNKNSSMFSWYDYRSWWRSPGKYGLRIDNILVSNSFYVENNIETSVDLKERMNKDGASDHLPYYIEFTTGE